jgi:DNA-directed RNA polymerase subunit omega
MAKKYEFDDVIEKVGGRFKLASLLEKRYKELLFGGRTLVDMQSTDILDILMQEVIEGKVDLVPEADAVAAAAAFLMPEKSDEAREEQKAREEIEKRLRLQDKKSKDKEEDEEE